MLKWSIQTLVCILALCSEILSNRNILTLQKSTTTLQPEKLQPGASALVSTTALTTAGLVCVTQPRFHQPFCTSTFSTVPGNSRLQAIKHALISESMKQHLQQRGSCHSSCPSHRDTLPSARTGRCCYLAAAGWENTSVLKFPLIQS